MALFKITELDGAVEQGAWDRYVEDNPLATGYHLTGWRTVIQRARLSGDTDPVRRGCFRTRRQHAGYTAGAGVGGDCRAAGGRAGLSALEETGLTAPLF